MTAASESDGPRPSSHGLAASRSHWQSATWLVPAAAILVYLVIAAVAYWPAESFSRSQILGCACSDPVQETWFLAWPAYALRHGLNPFFTSYLEYPHGVNMAVNTSMPLLGLLGAPITWLRGPIAAYNALMRLSFAASATSMLFVVRRFTSWWPAAFAAGLVYGFSPYMVGEGYGHLFLTFVPIPPLIMLCVYTLVRGPIVAGGREPLEVRKFARRRGLTLGALCVLQFFISTEVLVTTAVCIAIVAAAAALTHPREVSRALGRLVRAAGASAALFVPLVAYPVWFFLRGPQHIVGPPHAISNIAPIKADLFGAFVPTTNQLLGPAHLEAIGSSYGAGDLPENGVYLGVVLIALLVYLVVRFRREHLVLLGAGLALTGLVLALGTPLVVNNHATHIPLPFDVLVHLPLVQGIAALRLSLYEQLGAALVLGVGLDRVRRDGWAWHGAEPRGGAQGAGATTGRFGSRAVSVGLVGAIALVTLIPRYPYPSGPADIPSYFVSGADRAIPPGSVVLTYPYDIDPDNDAMLWQAVSGFRFKIFGGQATTPGVGGRATSAVASLQPSAMQAMFSFASSGTTNGVSRFALDPATLRGLRSFIVRYDVGTVVVEPIGMHPGLVVLGLSRALGNAPVVTGGVDVWYEADRAAAAQLR
ncbi:MAG: hypothetical protein ACLPQS_15030 [Acidimicrobiales bacterium]